MNDICKLEIIGDEGYYHLQLRVGVQCFWVGPEYETLEEVQWYRSQLFTALSKIGNVELI